MKTKFKKSETIESIINDDDLCRLNKYRSDLLELYIYSQNTFFLDEIKTIDEWLAAFWKNYFESEKHNFKYL